MEKTYERPLVICVGNMLMFDEGFGPHMHEVLTNKETALEYFDEEHADKLMNTFRALETTEDDDPRIPVLDAATMGMSMIPYIRDYDRIIVVDIFDCGPDSGIEPGTCVVLAPEDMADTAILHTFHDMRVSDVLNNAHLVGYDSDITCVCVQKKKISSTEIHIGIAPEVLAGVPYAVDAIMTNLGLE